MLVALPATSANTIRCCLPVLHQMLEAALAAADPSTMSWADMQRMLDQPADQAAATFAPPAPDSSGAIGPDGLVGVDAGRPRRAKPKLPSERRTERRRVMTPRDELEEEDDSGMPELPPHMLPGDPRAPEPEPESPPAPRRSGAGRAVRASGGEGSPFSDEEDGGGGGGGGGRGARRRTPPRNKAARKPRTSTTGPGKAAKAAMEIEAKRKARREAAEIEKARREAEVAEHGDRPNVLFRRLIDEFRDELGTGRRKIAGANYPRAKDGSPASGGGGAKEAGQGSLLVCVRKRPLLHHREGDEYDVLTSAGDRALICHEPRTKMDMSQTMEHHQFLFDHVFDEEASTADVYHGEKLTR